MAKQMVEKAEEPNTPKTQNDTGRQLATNGPITAPNTCPDTCPDKKPESRVDTHPDAAARQELATDAEKLQQTGGEKFFAAVDKAFASDGDKLSKKLMELAVSGNLWSAKLLIAVIDKMPRKKKADEGDPRIVEQWAAEPQWSETLTEQTAEVGSGGREPEI